MANCNTGSKAVLRATIGWLEKVKLRRHDHHHASKRTRRLTRKSRILNLSPLQGKGLLMFTPQQYRARAAEYTDLAKATNNAAEVRELRRSGGASRRSLIMSNGSPTIMPTRCMPAKQRIPSVQQLLPRKRNTYFAAWGRL